MHDALARLEHVSAAASLPDVPLLDDPTFADLPALFAPFRPLRPADDS